jgi:hypothetical protein
LLFIQHDGEAGQGDCPGYLERFEKINFLFMATILKSEQRDFQESPDKIDHYRIFPMFSPEVPQLGKFFNR